MTRKQKEAEEKLYEEYLERLKELRKGMIRNPWYGGHDDGTNCQCKYCRLGPYVTKEELEDAC